MHPSESPALNEADRAQLRDRGIDEAEFQRQLQCFARGFPPVALDRPATPGDGIVVLDAAAQSELLPLWRDAAKAGRLSRFIPASGAASRMFKALAAARGAAEPLRPDDLARLRASTEAADRDVARFFDHLSEFAFLPSLRRALAEKGLRLEEALTGDLRVVLGALLDEEGMGAGELPKGLLEFHREASQTRTAFEEQLAEARDTVLDSEGRCRVHFTVAPAWREAIESHLRGAAARLEDDGRVRFELSFSEQSPSTDTVASTPEGEPFREADGRLLFRPGGHGALIHNLGELARSGADVVQIKNIDNVTTSARRSDTILWKRLLTGALVQLEGEIASMRARVDDEPEVVETFVRERLFRTPPTSAAEADARREWLREILSRPLRVCGMVRNQGEPGGGPFWVRHADGGQSLQIVESSQVDHADPAQEAAFQASTHFNPVDLVCSLRTASGEPHDLDRFVDPETGFIATKSKDGRPLLALERPGLWNGAMARWLTVFVEVPLSTFSPVKTVLDLLRPEHQG